MNYLGYVNTKASPLLGLTVNNKKMDEHYKLLEEFEPYYEMKVVEKKYTKFQEDEERDIREFMDIIMNDSTDIKALYDDLDSQGQKLFKEAVRRCGKFMRDYREIIDFQYDD